jgi:hypothetical protein
VPLIRAPAPAGEPGNVPHGGTHDNVATQHVYTHFHPGGQSECLLHAAWHEVFWPQKQQPSTPTKQQQLD